MLLHSPPASHGFVVFENKKDATRAMQKCTEHPFLIGQSNKPVKVDWAWLEVRRQGRTQGQLRLAAQAGPSRHGAGTTHSAEHR